MTLGPAYGGGDGSGQTPATQALIKQNAIINGNFDIWQRGTSFASIVNGMYIADRFRWLQAGGGTGVVDALRSTDTPDAFSKYSLEVDVTTADTSIAVGDFYTVSQNIEGFNIQKFGFGAAGAEEITLSFKVRSSKTGIHCVSFRNSANDRSFVAEYTVNAINTWESKTITLTADITGTWVSDNGVGLRIGWAFAVGATLQAAAGSWTAGNFLASSNQVNLLDSDTNVFRISRIKLEVGSSATEFEGRSIGDELALCQRYFFKTFAQSVTPAQNAGRAGASETLAQPTIGDFVFQIDLPVAMRTTPTVVNYNPSAANALARNFTDGSDTPVANSNINDATIKANANPIDATDADDLMGLHMTADAEV